MVLEGFHCGQRAGPGAGRMEGPSLRCCCALCTSALASVSKALLEAGKGRRLKRSRERVHGRARWRHCVFSSTAVFGLSLPSCCLYFSSHPPSFCVVFITIITIISFLSHSSRPQPPPLAGPNPVGCNPRGAPDTVNSPFTRAAELLQTFLLIFTGLKASPFSLIIP